MQWTQISGTPVLYSDDGRWIIQRIGREYLLTTADGYAAWRPRKSIAACKRQAEAKAEAKA